MTKETQTQAIAEPFKFKNAALLNRLSEMAQVPYYATACHTLIQAEMAIVELERENATLRAEVERLAAQSAPTEEMSPEFTDTARAALLWVLWHHQGASSKVGQPIRFALGMDQYQPLSEYQVREAKRWEALGPAPAVAQSAPLQQAARPLDVELEKLIDDSDARWGEDVYHIDGDALMCLVRNAYGLAAARGAQSAPLQQAAREYPPLPEGKAAIHCVADTDEGGWVVGFDCEGPLSHEPEEGDVLFTADQMHAYLDADRAAAQVEPVRMLTQPELNDVALSEKVGWGPGEYVEAVQRALFRVNRGRVIPADGEVRS